MHRRYWQRQGTGGLDFTELGFGTAPLGNLYQAITEDDAQQVLEEAWAAGCRYFDTAPLYGLGLSETRLNRFLRGRTKDEYLLSTKVGRVLEVCPPSERTDIGRFFDTPSRKVRYDYSHDGVLRSLETSFERLGIDRIDIVFVHDLDIFTHGSAAARDARMAEFMTSGYPALVELREQGVISAIGGGMNEWQGAQMLAERGDFDLFLLAGRYTLLEQEALETFLPLCSDRGIGIVLGGPFNSGILASGPKPGAFYNYAEAPAEVVAKVASIESVCRRHGVAMIAAALQFPLMHPAVVSVIPGGQQLGHAAANARLLELNIPPDLWRDLKAEGLMRQDAPTGPRHGQAASTGTTSLASGS